MPPRTSFHFFPTNRRNAHCSEFLFYCTPYRGKREEFFQKKPKFFRLIFPENHRPRQKPPNAPQAAPDPFRRPPHQGAENPPIPQRAQSHCRQMVHPHPSAGPPREHQHRPCPQQPKYPVQRRRPQPRPDSALPPPFTRPCSALTPPFIRPLSALYPPPHHPKQVVNRPHSRPNGDACGEIRRLLQWFVSQPQRGIHAQNRLKKPLFSAFPSS